MVPEVPWYVAVHIRQQLDLKQSWCNWMQLGYLGEKLNLQRMVPDSRVCSIFEFELIIFDGICSIFVLELVIQRGSLEPGFIQGSFGVGLMISSGVLFGSELLMGWF